MLKFLISCLLILAISIISFPIKSFSRENIKFEIVNIPETAKPTTINNNDDFDFIQSTLLPSIISIPTGDLLAKKPLLAFPGSTPSFQIRFKNKPNTTQIRTVNLTDSAGNEYIGIPFFFQILTENNETILSITIPDETSLGNCKITLNLFDNTSISNNKLEIINFYQIQTKKNKQSLNKPVINNIKVKKSESGILLSLHGKNFAPKNIIYTNNSIRSESLNTENTLVTTFPNNLLELLNINIINPNELKIQLGFIDATDIPSEIILVVSTPRGITSKLIRL